MIVFKQGMTSRSMKFAIAILAVLFLVPFIAHADTTIQHTRINLVTGISSIPAAVNLTAPFNLTSPDGMNSTVYANVYADGYYSANSTIFLWINNQSCVNANFSIPLGAAAAQATIHFDCSNIIKKQGTYNFTAYYTRLASSVSTWIEIGYLNKPIGQIKYLGATDYWQGETATVFVQLQDADGNAVNNASCNFDMYNSTNPLLTPLFNKQPMVFRGADGIYYYQFSTVGMVQGVYPLDAECAYVFDNNYYYSASSLNAPNITINSGTLQGGSPFNLNSGSDGLYYQVSAIGGTMNLTLRWDNVSTNTTSMTFIWLGEVNNDPRTITAYAKNWTSGNMITLGTMNLIGTGSAGSPTGVDALLTANYPANMSQFINSTGSVSVDVVVTGGAGQTFNNWITLKSYKNSSYVTSVKGSSEVHIYPLNISDMPYLTWNFTNRNLTFYNTTGLYTNQQQIIGLLTGMANLTAAQVWNYTPTRTLTDYNNTEIIGLLKGMANLTASDVWIYANRTLTFFNYTEQALYVWNSTDRNLTYYQVANISNLTVNINASDIANQVWNFTSRTLTDYNLTGMPQNVWTYNSRTLTDYNNTEIVGLLKGLANLTASDVWTYVNRTLTFFDYQTQALFVWNSTTRDLTNYNTTQIYTAINNIPANTWAYTTRTLTDYNNTEIIGLIKGLANLTAQDVWTYSNRNLTYFDYQTQGFYLWNSTTRNLTEYNTTTLQTSINNVPLTVWTYSNRTLTDYNNSNVAVNVTQFWSYPNRTLTDYNLTQVIGLLEGMANLTASDVWSYGNRTLTFFDYSTQALYVWNATTRELTFYNSSNLTASDIWTFNTRDLTNYNTTGISNQITAVPFNVWNYTNRTLTDYNNTNITAFVNVTEIWTYATRTLTDYNTTGLYNGQQTIIGLISGLANVTAQDIWTYSNRTLTFFDYQTQALYVWNETSRNLTFYNTTNLQASIDNTPSLVWAFTPRTLTDYNNSNLTVNAVVNVSQVWEYANRTLTDYNLTQIYGLLTGMSNLTAADVWAYSNRNLTYFDYQTQGFYVWNSTTRTLTDYNNTNISINVSSVWNYPVRTLTDYNNTGIIESLTEINFTVSSTNLTANNIYTYLTGTIKPLLDMINSTVTAIQAVVNSISSDVVILNSTANRIENNTIVINQTVTQINDTVNWINQSLVPNTIYIW